MPSLAPPVMNAPPSSSQVEDSDSRPYLSSLGSPGRFFIIRSIDPFKGCPYLNTTLNNSIQLVWTFTVCKFFGSSNTIYNTSNHHTLTFEPRVTYLGIFLYYLRTPNNLEPRTAFNPRPWYINTRNEGRRGEGKTGRRQVGNGCLTDTD